MEEVKATYAGRQGQQPHALALPICRYWNWSARWRIYVAAKTLSAVDLKRKW